MNVDKLIELTERHRQLEEQIAELTMELSEVEGKIESSINGTPVTRPKAKRKAPTTPATKTKKRRSGYKRRTQAGDEITAIADLVLEYFKNHPDQEISCQDLYDIVGTTSETDESRVRAAVNRLKKSQWVAKAGRGVYVLQRVENRKQRAEEDEKSIIQVMKPEKPMRAKEILSKIDPPSYRYHALETRLCIMADSGTIKRVERGVYVLPAH